MVLIRINMLGILSETEGTTALPHYMLHVGKNYESLLSMICVYELHAYQWPNLPLIAGEYGGT